MKIVTMVGTFPPNKGVSDTCVGQVEALCTSVRIKFIGFKQLYPKSLYPGKMIVKDFETPRLDNVKIKKIITWYNPLSWLKAAFLVEGEILHVHWWTYILFPPLFTIVFINKLRGKRIICSVHNVLGHESNFIDSLFTKIFLKRIDHLIAHTKVSKEKIQKLFKINKSKIQVMPLGIPDFIVGKVSNNKARKKLGISKDKKVILGFGHIRKYKGTDVLIKAFADLRQNLNNSLLLIAGESWVDWSPYQNLIDKFKINKDILLKLDFIDMNDVKYYFIAADIVVLPYIHFDGQSGPGRIALGYEKPMVVSNVGGLPDLVPEECVFRNLDYHGLSKKLELFLSNDEKLEQLSKYSSKKNEELKWKNISKGILEIYE